MNSYERLFGALMNKRQFLIGAGSAAVGLGLARGFTAQGTARCWDLIFGSAGTDK